MSEDQRPITLADVARHAGVSPAAASFVLFGRGGKGPSGSPQTQSKVRAAAERLGYVPNRNARAIRTGRYGGIVLALGTLGDPWGVSLARAVRSRALDNDLSTLILGDERWYEFLLGSAYDCSFITGADFVENGPDRIRMLSNSAARVVAFSETMEPERFDVISSSPLPAVHAAYDMLRARHERVMLLTQSSATSENRPTYPSRTTAFFEAAERHGDGPLDSLVRRRGGGRAAVYKDALEWLAGPEKPDAVICSTGYESVSLQVAATKAGLRVPEDLEIVSIGDVPESAELLGPISYFGVQDVFDRIADVVITRALDHEGLPGEKYEFTWEFFEGETTLSDGGK
jgi:DNA-binding LacI/PurR family transcriptional regulator